LFHSDLNPFIGASNTILLGTPAAEDNCSSWSPTCRQTDYCMWW